MTHALVPPHDLQAEEAVLGAVLLTERVLNAYAFQEDLRAEHFYRESHRRIWQAMSTLHGAGEPVDQLTVANQLQRTGELEQVGGHATLDALTAAPPSVGNLRRYAQIVRDHAYARAVLHATYEIQAQIAERALSAEEVIADAEQRVFAIGRRSRQDRAISLADALSEELERLGQAAASDRAIRGTPTGFGDLDEAIGGMQAGNLIVLAARPSMGKSALAQNIATHVAFAERRPVILASLEMSDSELAQRHLAAAAKVRNDKIRKARLEQDEWQLLLRAAADADGVPLTILDEADLSVPELHAKARAIAANHREELGLVVVDYLQLMRPHGGGSGNRTEDVSEMSRGLKRLARDLRCPVLALSQLNRAVEQRADRRPLLSDLRESGQIEGDANVVLMLYRDDYYEPDSERPGETDVLVRKNRNGPLAEIVLRYDAPRLTFRPHRAAA
jgi:replicative DNA helicase